MSLEASRSKCRPLATHRYLLAVVAVFASGCTDPPEGFPSAVVVGARGHRLDEVVIADTGFNGSVLAVWQDEVVLAKGYGLADPESRNRNSASTVFDMGSVVKDFTLAAILHLESRGRLSTSDSLETFFPDITADKAVITLDQVMRMQAGFHEYHDETGDFQKMDREEAVRRILAQRLLFEPGTEAAYSNSGYTLLAVVVELVSGRTFQQYVRDSLFVPAGMTTAGFYGDRNAPPERIAVGHNGVTQMGEKNTPPYWPEVTWALAGSGGVYGSVWDLFRWRRAVGHGSILTDSTLEKYGQYRVAMPDPSGNRVRFAAGGNDFGFVFVSVELVDENGLLLFAQNNNPTGEEDPLFVRALLEALRQ
jgi:CubicO group peptidase (beta-lactamase class C family)